MFLELVSGKPINLKSRIKKKEASIGMKSSNPNKPDLSKKEEVSVEEIHKTNHRQYAGPYSMKSMFLFFITS